MITPYNATRGIDLYSDSSGEDDWGIAKERFYLHGLMLAGPSPEWLKWMQMHQTEYDGMVHWSLGIFGSKKQKLEDKKRKCRELLAMHPWFQTTVFAFDKLAFKEFIYQRTGRTIKKYEVAKSVWKMMGASLIKTVIPGMKALVLNNPWGCLNLREVVINNPKGGDKGAIEAIIKKELGRAPKFVPAGHYGLDALDGVLWALHRCINLRKTDCLPTPIHQFSSDLNVHVFGIRKDRPTPLQDINGINEFTKG